MGFVNRCWEIGSCSLLLLTQGVAMAEMAPATRPASQQKLGGVSIACYQQFAQQLSDPELQHLLLFEVLDHYENGRRDDLTLQLADAIHDPALLDLKLSALSWLIRSALQTGDNSKAIALLTQIAKLAQDLENSARQAQFLQQMGLYWMQAGRPEQAAAAFAQSTQLYENSPRLFAPQKVDFLTQMAGWYTAIGKPNQAVQYLNRSLRLLQSIPDQDFLYNLNKMTLLAQLSFQFAAAGQPQPAEQLFAQSLQIASTAKTKPVVGQQLAALFETTLKFIPAQELAQLSATRQASLQAMQQQNRDRIIEQLLHALQSPQVTVLERKPMAWALGEMWASTHQVERAVQYASTLSDPINQFSLLLSLLTTASQTQEGITQTQLRALLATAHKTAQSIPDPDIQGAALVQVARFYAKWDQLTQALQVLDGIQDKVQKQAAVAEVAETLVDRGQADEALRLIAPLPPTLPALVTEPVLNKVAQTYARTGRLEQGLQIAQRITQTQMRQSALSVIATEWAKAGNTSQAIATLQSLEASTQTTLFQEMTDQAIAAGNLEQAERFAQQIPTAFIRNGLWEAVAIAYAEAGQYPKAMQLAQTLRNPTLTQLVTCARSAPTDRAMPEAK